MPSSDDRLIDDDWARRVSAGVAAGSRASLAALYEERFERLFRFVRSRSRRDDAFALDCVHDAWVRVVRSLPALTSLAALDGWLMRATLSATLDRLKSERRRLAREALHVVEPQSTTETIESLARQLDRLTADDRSLLQLRFWRGLSIRHIAAALGVGEKTVEMRLRRAVGRLHERMEAPDDRA